jgi:phosphonate transport system substrate-binding protein
MKIFCLGIGALMLAACSAESVPHTDSVRPLQVILIPADGGTEDGTKADFEPVFDALERTSDLTFELRVGQSYNAVVEALCSGSADIAFVGPASYIQANERGCADLLAVGVENGKSEYFAGLFGRRRDDLKSIGDLRGKSVAFGDVNSASSFKLVGSHANAIAALGSGQVDVAALSLVSYEKAVQQGAIDPAQIRLIARSRALPNPPIVMRASLPPESKAKLKAAFEGLPTAKDVTPDMLIGYGGKRVDRYATDFDPAGFKAMSIMMQQVTPELKAAMLAEASKS